MTLSVDGAEARVGEHVDGPDPGPDPGPGAAPGPAPAPGGGTRRGLAAVAVGAFCCTLALLAHFYVHPRLAMLPAEARQVWTLEDPEATYLDTARWRTREDAEVTQRTELVARPMPGNEDWAVWSITVDTASRLGLIDHHDRKVVVDRATAEAVNCCGEHVDGDFAVRQAGLVALWPPGAEGAEFPFYVPDMRSAPVMRLRGEDRVGGITARRYEQSVPATQVPGSAREVPAAEMGLDRPGTVRATRWVELARTYWVEPVSGQVVNITEERRETLRTAEGDGGRLVLDADLAMRPEHVQANIQRAGDRARLLDLVRVGLPLVLGTVGAVLLLAGAVRSRLPR
ncbi:DUF3068 domain-containing protein [Actinorugispora endophytica]|uniref:DUF3068 family protein n=1 Tax=Actinorugispora endophytica TaxID=1605990 RepID=A0A4R6UXM8_9ACTN|nr:DUF3068 domain-containing protein [Actinorugispora endophytica]TDQ52001.1 DUF3068 family protein [Actinorugispora endophytica]